MGRKLLHHRDDNTSKLTPDDEFKELLFYIKNLANHKMGYPVSLLTYLGLVDNQRLGIMPDSLANILLNNVGDPFRDSLTSLMEVKEYERKLIAILEKFYGLALNEARGYVTTGGTEGNFAAMWWTKRFMINTALPILIKTDDQTKLLIKEEQELIISLAKIPLNEYKARIKKLEKIITLKNSISSHKEISQQLLTPTVFYSKQHTHYSIAKIAEVLRLNVRPLASNNDGSVDLKDFRKELLIHLEAHPFSSIIVIANIGTTVTGAIDDVPNIKKILEEHPRKPIFSIHMDGALTGFVLPIVKPFGNVPDYFESLGVNTLTVSAHKYPGLSQPCGIFLTRKSFFDKAFEKSERSIEYVGDIRDVTITGSRSGLNVLMFYNALRVFGLDKGNERLTEMVNENLENARYLCDKLVKIFGEEQVYHPFHFNVMFPRPSMALAKKYQLMITGDKATICVLTNVTKELIDRFINDIKLDKEDVMNTETIKPIIKPLTAEYISSATELFIKTFCNNEPVTKHLGIQQDDFEQFATEIITKAVRDGLSKVAVNHQNKVVACVIAEDIADPFTPQLSDYPKLKPVISLIEQLSQPFLAGKRFKKGKIAHFWIASVEPELMGRGLFKELNAETIKAAAIKGFDFAYAEFTNEISEKITHQFDVIQKCNEIKYEDFLMDKGKKPFQGLKGRAASYVAAIKPGIGLDSLTNCYILETINSLS